MTENTELRCYTFTLVQLNSIQQGIQAGHAIVELSMKSYMKQMTLRTGVDWSTIHKWATNWKTVIYLNGGCVKDLYDLSCFFQEAGNRYPWASFTESEESLGGLLTSIAVILPERIFGTADNMRKLKAGEVIPKLTFTEWEYELIERLSKARKAQ
jgi:hypothetical protein